MITRRGVLRTGLRLTLAGACVVSAARAMAADAAACADSKMDSGLASSLHYTEHSPDPAKPCAGCGFFTAVSGGCGSCAIFSSSVNSNGHCDSWAPKG